MKNHVKEFSVDLAILDLRVSNSEGGIEMTKFIKMESPRTKIIIYSGHVDRSYIAECTDLDVDAFVSKDSPIDEVKEAIQQVFKNNRYYSENVKSLVLSHAFNRTKYLLSNNIKDRLTPREIEVIKLICKGYDYKRISKELFISLGTARKHRQNIMLKTDCKNGQHLYQYALENGII